MRRHNAFWLGVLVGVLVISSILIWPLARQQLDKWQLLPRPEGYTELYFVDHQQLPRNYQAGQTWPLNFVIKNQQGQTVDYRYEVVIDDGRQRLVLDTKQISLLVQQASQQRYTIRPTDSYQSLKIEVNLTYHTLLPHQSKPQFQQQQIIYQMQSLSTDPSL